MMVGANCPHQLSLDPITPNKVVEDRADERTLGMKKMTTAGFQQHQSDRLGDFLNVWARTQVPIPTPVNFRSDSQTYADQFIWSIIMKAAWGGPRSSVSSLMQPVLLPQNIARLPSP